MKRTNHLDIQTTCRLQHLLHLGTIFSNDTDIIPPCLPCPVILHVQSAKFSETIRREKHLLSGLICHHNLRPVYHGSIDKIQRMPPQFQFSPISRSHLPNLIPHGKILPHHPKCLGRGDHLGIRILFQKQRNTGRMVRLHMLYHQIVRPAPLQSPLQILQPLLPKSGVHRIHHRHLLIQDHIGIIRHSIGHLVLPLKQIHLMVIDPHIYNTLRHLHSYILLSTFIYPILNVILLLFHCTFHTSEIASKLYLKLISNIESHHP